MCTTEQLAGITVGFFGRPNKVVLVSAFRLYKIHLRTSILIDTAALFRASPQVEPALFGGLFYSPSEAKRSFFYR